MNQQALNRGIQHLADEGLNLFAAVHCKNLPEHIPPYFEKADINLQLYKTLVLIGHGGRRLWESISAEDWEKSDPIDSYSQQKAENFINQHLSSYENRLLFPSNLLIPLQQIGQHVGWSHSSPLGLGINSDFGAWFAYRAAFITTAVLPETPLSKKPSPCESCLTKPCISSCPGKATHPTEPFNVEACATHRLKINSSCQDRCLARMACPFFPEHQYSLPQIQYHYGLSKTTFENYFPHLIENSQ